MDNPKFNKNNNGNKDSGNCSNKEVVLDLSKELVDANIVSEMKYTAALDDLKITFSKYYDNQAVHLPVNIKNWYAWTGNLKAMIRRRVSVDDDDYLLIENTILDNLYLIHEARENHSQLTLKNTQRKEEREEGKTSLLKKYVFEGTFYESNAAILEKNPRFIAISLPSSSSTSSTESSLKDDATCIEDGSMTAVDNAKNELSSKIDVAKDNLITLHPIPYSSADSQEEQKNYIETEIKIKIEEESPQNKLGGTEI